MPKFMLSVSSQILQRLQEDAAERGTSVQELIRAVIIPAYYGKGELPKPTYNPARLKIG